MKKSRLFAPFLMLLAAAVASIVMFRGNYDLTEQLVILLCVMVFFYLVGAFIQKKIISFMDQIRENERMEAENEGEVIEKAVLPSEEGKPEGKENV
ncbi:MAG: hypothetical protein ACI4ED_00270 [Suilimivivens sp.]